MAKGPGSNQYQQRGAARSRPVANSTSLIAQAASQRLCGQVWGTWCEIPVNPPDWSHGDHPSPTSKTQAASKSTDQSLLTLLSHDPNCHIRAAVASNNNCPTSVATQLVDDPDVPIREALAAHPYLPPGILDRLAKDIYQDVRTKVASNPACPPSALRQLAHHPAHQVRLAVADNDMCPPEILAELAADQDTQVRQRLLERRDCPPAALTQLATDPHSWTGFVADVIAHPNCPPNLIQQVYQETPNYFEEKVAMLRRCPPELLDKLAHSTKMTVRAKVAANPSSPATALNRYVWCWPLLVSTSRRTSGVSPERRPDNDSWPLGPLARAEIDPAAEQTVPTAGEPPCPGW